VSEAAVKIAAIIPALDEEAALPRVLADIPRDLVGEVVVVDNGSRDATAAVARAGGATVLSEPRRGYGSACLRGLAYLWERRPDVVVFLDGDYSDRGQEMRRLLRPILEGGCDMVIGSRVRGEVEKGALLPQARLGNALATWLIRVLFGFRYTDLGPFRAVVFEKLAALDLKDRGYGWTVEMQVKAVQRGLRIAEVPVGYRRRIGRSKVTGTWKGSVMAGGKILWTIARCALEGAGRGR
jgi:hypothetical protein